jgi:5'-nucleotidase/UDP-sugar diphosphatase
MVESMRETDKNLLLLDYGGIFADRGDELKLKADLTLKSMNLMGYDAVNIGSREFSFGQDYLKTAGKEINFPFISSNLTWDGNSNLPIKPYIVKKAGNTRVGILGILHSDAFKYSTPQYVEGLKIIKPETALKNIVPELRKKADFIVLLSQEDFESTASLVNTVKGIDLAISYESASRGCGQHSEEDEIIKPDTGNTLVIQANLQGEELGVLEIQRKSGKAVAKRDEALKAGNDASENEEIAKMINSEFTDEAEERRRAEAEKRRQEMHKELMEGLKLSPEEFMKQYQEKNKG